MSIFKQFSLEERITIQNELNSRTSFKALAEQLGKAPSSISREVRRHVELKESGVYGRQFIHKFLSPFSEASKYSQGRFKDTQSI